MSLCPCAHWKFARGQGNLIIIKIQLDGANNGMACNFRQWPGQPAYTTSYTSTGGYSRDSINERNMRGWKQGFTCNRVLGESRGLSRDDYRLDFNVLDGDNEPALPSTAGGNPTSQLTAGMGAGKTWYHREGKFSFSVLNIGAAACSRSPLYPTYTEWGSECCTRIE